MKYSQFLTTISCASLLFLACNQTANKKADVRDSVKENSQAYTRVILKDNHVNDAYEGYIALKDALVSSNVGNAQQAASALSESLKKIEGCDNTALIAKKIASSSNLAEQRKNFTPLSSDLIALMKHADVEQGTMYVQYCPMANSGNGGYWMASNQEIRNPYYGDEMLKCGEVKESITKR